MFSMLLLTVVLATPTPSLPDSSTTEFVVPADDWARPRNGARVAELPSLRAAVSAWRADETATLVIIHPGGEAGALWGSEVRDWLVALGFAPARLALRPGSMRDDAVVLRLERGR